MQCQSCRGGASERDVIIPAWWLFVCRTDVLVVSYREKCRVFLHTASLVMCGHCPATCVKLQVLFTFDSKVDICLEKRLHTSAKGPWKQSVELTLCCKPVTWRGRQRLNPWPRLRDPQCLWPKPHWRVLQTATTFEYSALKILMS